MSCRNEIKEDIITVIVENKISNKNSDTSTINELKYFVKPINEELKFYKQKNYHTYINKRNYKDSLMGIKGSSNAILRDSSEIYTKNTTFNYKRYYFPNEEPSNGYILKKQIISKQHMYAEGNGKTKNILNIFKIDNNTRKILNEPLYSFTGYCNEVEVLGEEGYFLTSSYGCCSNPNYFELYDLFGQKIISSNNAIYEIITNNEASKYYIGVLFEDEFNSESLHRLIIKYPDNNIQTLIIEGNTLDTFNDYRFNIYDSTKPNNSFSGNFYSGFYSQVTIDSLDNAQIILPLINKDTLRIPFKNGKPFGRSDKQLLITLDKN